MKIIILAALALAGAATAGVVAQAGASKTTIRVTEREYRIFLTSRHATGPVRFVVKNTGTHAHALAISGAGVKVRTRLIQPGQTAVLNVTLRQSRYTLSCPVPGHAAQGMKATLNAPAGAGTTTTTPTTTDTDTGTTTDPGYGYGY